MKMKFTDDRVRKLKPEDFAGREHIWHSDIPGFGIRRRASGHTTFVVHYRFGGRSIPYTLGPTSLWRVAAATTEAQRILAQVKLGRDPQAEKAIAHGRAAETFESVRTKYLAFAKLKLRTRSYDEVNRHLTSHLSSLSNKSIHAIDKLQAAEALETIRLTSGPGAADRTRASAIAMFTWAMRNTSAERNPFALTSKFDLGQSRDRVLSDSEIAEVWKNSGEDDYGRIVRLLLLTGARRDEVSHAKREEFNLNGRLWTLPKERAKNNTEIKLPLTALTLKILESIPEREDSDFIFGTGQRGFQGWSRAKAALDARILKSRLAAGNETPIEPWVLHDLRRTCATRMGDIGILPHHIEACLNHKSGSKAGVAGVYNHAQYATAMRDAFDRWARYVEGIVSDKPSNVLPLVARQ
jgi:integrase